MDSIIQQFNSLALSSRSKKNHLSNVLYILRLFKQPDFQFLYINVPENKAKIIDALHYSEHSLLKVIGTIRKYFLINNESDLYYAYSLFNFKPKPKTTKKQELLPHSTFVEHRSKTVSNQEDLIINILTRLPERVELYNVKWKDYQDGVLNLVGKKSKRLLHIEIDLTPGNSEDYIFTTQKNKQFTEPNFDRVVKEAFRNRFNTILTQKIIIKINQKADKL